MAFRDLLVLVDTGMEAASTYGLGLSVACNASLTAAVPIIEPSLPPNLVAGLSDDFLSRIREDAEASASRALQDFSEAARQARTTTETMKFKSPSGDIGYPLSRLARCFDATLLPQPDPNGIDTSDIVEAVLFDSGRPVIIVPYVRARPEVGTALIAWDGGQPAARAVADALPILALAHHVQIVMIGRGEDEDAHLSGMNLLRHLARHGINAEPKSLLSDEVDAANMLLSHAADIGAGLIVMGGYGHSRLREFVLGGVTREILRSMTVPVLMSH